MFECGRANFALTVFVPYDCTNNCPFCTTKKLYNNIMNPADAEVLISEHLGYANKSDVIKDIVFTGGEPMYDLEMLSRLIKLVSDKNVYINTNLVKENFFQFVKLVNRTANVKGISVSRHTSDYAAEPQNNVEDWCLEAFEKPVRINVVLDSKKKTSEMIGFVEDVLSRWSHSSKNISVNFRADFRNVTTASIHDMKEPMAEMFIRNYNCVGHSWCEVCDTLRFEDTQGRMFAYHRGLEHSSVTMRNKIIVSDAILIPHVDTDTGEPNYKLCYDWDKSSAADFEDFLYPTIKARKKRAEKTGTAAKPIGKKKAPPKKAADVSAPTVPKSSSVSEDDGFWCGGIGPRC